MSEATALKLPESTPFPINVFSVLIRKGETVSKHQQVIRYTYWEFQDAPEAASDYDEDNKSYISKNKVRVDLVGSYESPIDGVVEEVLIRNGDEVISQDQEIAKIIEPCTHSIQYGGLCALCGKSLDEETDYSGFKYEDRAPISMSHGTSDLKISKSEAQKVEQLMTKNLIKENKLILVVDLDQTVIHATVDPTIGEWMNDQSNPNFPSLKDVQYFSLEEEPILPPGYQGPRPPTHKRWYYVKMRPGLEDFLKRIAKIYELHIYTMGTKEYARSIAKIIDPDGEYFGERILSRDESGSLTQKSLERLFPTDTSMVVIIDDRGDVWNWSDHLIKVVPFDFFVGIGDINSNFLPKQKSLLGPTKGHGSIEKLEEQLIEELQGSENSKESQNLERKIEEIKEDQQIKQKAEDNKDLELSEEQTAELAAARSSEREASLEQQKSERPMEKLQKNLDKLSEAKNKHGIDRLLYDDDDELVGLEKALNEIHETFYSILKKNQTHPDVKEILPQKKHEVFGGFNFVFSGLFPIGGNINNEHIVIWVKSFGASVSTDITMETTHVITKSPHTYKARLAKTMIPNVKVVHPNWLFDSMSNWRPADDIPFEIKIPKERYLPEKEVEKYQEKLKNSEEKLNDIENNIENDNLLGGNMNWLDIDDEVEEFLNSDSDEEEDDIEGKNSNKRGIDGDSNADEYKRRKLDSEENDESDDDDDFAAELMLELDGDDE
ncbi:RNA polymerase II subunit A C-terminal domain phosphatase [Wickerhamomyces ciferrii]|uniref:RNA polymerase II subunit A C-terminal domain phosphatase n=1 Tax=Wickerhamomyces ciferrii (strain ATCC 14091 / BCRC 22168 / CBS 111 / JCM 3599 / NBRC 0793 / NRRL Y-1031 F-60-10) TaxID=1206466 RepID=K0KT76_WICCF|nr:RNA polymerase II subunit A C-terminal domain phosphatase [Wickerhamomyces ciferrii]CCH46356.1 RNA polymerase II subunit A C-terminal domain phosphatase [Wickerhamomyces ciferrii]